MSPTLIRELVEKMLRSNGGRIAPSTPFVDAFPPDGSRLHVVIADTIGAFVADLLKVSPDPGRQSLSE